MHVIRFQVLDQVAGNRDLVYEFFGAFSRFEYALKRSKKFLRPDRRDAVAAWTKYAKSLGGRLSASHDTAVVSARTRLLADPPKTQVRNDENELEWCETEPGAKETPDAYLLRLVRTVRNNLFHGGKYPPPIGPVTDVARNRGLLEDCLTVLGHCLALSPELGTWFAEAA